MELVDLVLVFAVSALLFGVISRPLAHSPLTAPMVFTGIGLAAGPLGFDLVAMNIDSESLLFICELALVLTLFTDASRIDIVRLKHSLKLPSRLLGIGLPLTVAVGAVGATLLFPQFDMWDALLLAVVLAPTDAALGQAIVTLESIPTRIRQTLNVESGLNDGAIVPVFMIVLWCAGSSLAGAADSSYWIRFVALQLVLAPFIGASVAWGAGWLIRKSREARWITADFQRLSLVAAVLLAWAVAHLVNSNGFIAAFVTGLTLRRFYKEIVAEMHLFAEAEGQLLNLIVFLLFGLTMVPTAISIGLEIDVAIMAFSALSLTAFRMIPTSIALAGTNLHVRSHLFLGWFGPRGLASIILGLLILDRSGIEQAELIFTVTTTTVFLSIVLHGLTAWPLSRLYGSFAGEHPSCDAERLEIEPMPTRYGHRRTNL